MTRRTASIRIDEEILGRLDGLAKSMDRSRSWVISHAIERYLDYEAWFDEKVREGVAEADRGELIPHRQVIDELRREGTPKARR